MQNQFTADDHQFVQDEIRRLGNLPIYNHAEFVAGCHRHSGGLIAEWTEGANFVADTVIAHLNERKPFSMIRIGDGEGNVLALTDRGVDHLRELKWFNAIFYDQDRQFLGITNAETFAATMEDSVRHADVLGIRAFPFFDEFSELEIARNTLAVGGIRGALGMLRARQAFERLLLQGRLVNTIVTSAWVHLTLLRHLDRMINAAPNIIIISGRTALSEEFSCRYDSKPVKFVSIPIEACADIQSERHHHFSEAYEHIISSMRGDLAGTFVLVGAGIFGKAYCQAAKRAGAVALDLGSAFDILAGLKTRPVHDNEDVVDIDAMRWL